MRPARPPADLPDPLPQDTLTNPQAPLPIPPYRWDDDRRALLRADLDGWFAHAYGLTRDELRYVLDPADVMGPDYPSETFRVLKDNELKRHGEYRTQRLVLAAYDRLAAERAAVGLDHVDAVLGEASRNSEAAE